MTRLEKLPHELVSLSDYGVGIPAGQSLDFEHQLTIIADLYELLHDGFQIDDPVPDVHEVSLELDLSHRNSRSQVLEVYQCQSVSINLNHLDQIHARADGSGRLYALMLTAGQVHDIHGARALLARVPPMRAGVCLAVGVMDWLR